MSQTKLTYLLGAGASAQAVPVVSQLYDRMEFFINQFENDSYYRGNLGNYLSESLGSEKLEEEIKGYYNKIISNLSKKENLKGLVVKMKKILESARTHQSIDTYAKMLFLQKETEKYEEVKRFLSVFLIFEQIGFITDRFRIDKFVKDLEKRNVMENSIPNFNSFNVHIDKRYDQFFAALLRNCEKAETLQMPSNLNLISWNYDSQMELVLQKYAQVEYFLDVGEYFKLYPRGQSFESSQTLAEDSLIIKINGSCGLETDVSEWYFTAPDSTTLILPFLSLLGKILDPQQEELFETKLALSFAWDDGNSSPGFVLDICRDKISKSSSIVIIGYSFPVFNREIDKQIFSKLREGTKIYIQDLPGNINSVIHAAKSIMPDGIEPIPIDKVDQFYLPFEFVPEYC